MVTTAAKNSMPVHGPTRIRHGFKAGLSQADRLGQVGSLSEGCGTGVRTLGANYCEGPVRDGSQTCTATSRALGEFQECLRM